MSEEKNMQVQIVSPDGVIWEGSASFAVLPADDGELGIYPAHAPLLARLGVGEARIYSQGETRYFALFGGFLEVVDDRVQVLVDRAETPALIDVDAAKAELERLSAAGIKEYDRHEEELRLRLEARTRLKVAARR
jgi:F-type H+-transporting ATPase subunit epsilon